MLVNRAIENFYTLNWLQQFMIGHNGIICGGCFKNIFSGEKVKDIDVFFRSRKDFNDAVEYFDIHSVGYEGYDKGVEEYQFYYENENVKAYKCLKTDIVVELCRKIFGEPRVILDNFDFTITKFALYKELVPDDEDEELFSENDFHWETKILCDECFFEHLHLKRLVIDNNIPYPMSTFERMFRYAKYGFFPCKETKLKLIEAIRELSDEQVQVSESLYEGLD